MTITDLRHTIETIFRIERARLIASLARMVRDVGLAEELAQDAFVTALSEWPRTGVPTNPGAWLNAAARRRAIDLIRRNRMLARKHAEIGRDLSEEDEGGVAAIEAAMDDEVGDELLSLIFIACHPILSPEARVALTLRLIGGLTTEEIARAYLASEATIAQRIVRAKRALGKAGLSFEVPRGRERQERLSSVLAVIYLIFNEGYSATSGADLTRPVLCAEAQRLARILAGLAPDEPEVLGLLALVEIQASRLAARIGPDGLPIPLTEQNRARWDRLLIRRGLLALERAEALGGALGPYALQAALAACHARANRPEDTDWARIAGLYDLLCLVMPSPVVELNRAVAHSMAFGPDTGLRLLDDIDPTSLAQYAPLPAARGAFLLRAGRPADARAQFELAASLSRNERERAFLLGRAAACSQNADQNKV
ncbi:RNA polymerase sigma factor [Microvirga lotononidis]|uniref:RNA polymerase sigma factor, sigma-70 family n=1 Tax=Microvirga lotononidis TaxID=864069 RepID=I4YW96_9HYPH|nr:RNA polymerase sigma factor [Microvirga lotononidis]EIM28238.1 RNA polymerase sigma factor, sigma-70 family [Microvirga lotononidis]WQO27667.1 RNA polymerase sigma factor [Microvirga lotononidis]